MLQTWPTPSPTAETVLVRRDGDEVVFLKAERWVHSRAHIDYASNGTPLRMVGIIQDISSARSAWGAASSASSAASTPAGCGGGRMMSRPLPSPSPISWPCR